MVCCGSSSSSSSSCSFSRTVGRVGVVPLAIGKIGAVSVEERAVELVSVVGVDVDVVDVLVRDSATTRDPHSSSKSMAYLRVYHFQSVSLYRPRSTWAAHDVVQLSIIEPQRVIRYSGAEGAMEVLRCMAGHASAARLQVRRRTPF